MTYLDGLVPADDAPPGLESETAQRALGEDLVDALVEIHAADVATPGLAAFGRPGSYNERQVRRFAQLWEINKTREIAHVEEVSAWLSRTVPDPLPPTVVHGDFRLGNTMVDRNEPSRILAVLDWEMGAIGDPRADVGYLLATYSEPGGPPSPLGTSLITTLVRLPVTSRARRALRRQEADGTSSRSPGSKGLRSGRQRSSARRSTAATCAASWEPRTSAPRVSSRVCPISRRRLQRPLPRRDEVYLVPTARFRLVLSAPPAAASRRAATWLPTRATRRSAPRGAPSARRARPRR